MNRKKLAIARSAYRAAKCPSCCPREDYLAFVKRREWAARWLKRMGVFVLLALALCGCQQTENSDTNEKIADSTCNGFMCVVAVETDGVKCIAVRAQGNGFGGLSCDWTGYHQRKPESVECQN